MRYYLLPALLAVVSLLSFAEDATCQEAISAPVSVFAGVGYSENFSRASILAYESGGSICGTFQNGNASQPDFFAGVSLPLGNALRLIPRLSFANLSTSFTTTASPNGLDPSAFQISTGDYHSIQRTRAYDANLKALYASSDIAYPLLPNLEVSAGLYVGAFVTHSFIETEKITVPSNAVYAENLLTTRTIGSGQLNVHPFQAGAEFGIGYSLGFQRNLTLRPSLGIQLPFTTVSDRSSGAWRVFPVSASLALSYAFPEAVPTVPATPTIAAWDSMLDMIPTSKSAPVAFSPLHVSIKAFGVSDDGKQVEEPVLSVERMHVTEVYPMLHYVFFDDGSASIPARYQHPGEPFAERALYTSSALDIHHRVLDILGKRLQEHPNASITVLGTRSEHSPLDSLAGAAIADERARSIADYLRTHWEIASSRIKLRSRNLPELASDDHNAFGEAENRRVEIIPSTTDITAPLWTERIEKIATPPHINFDPTILIDSTSGQHVSGIKSATIVVKQRDHVLQTFDALTGGSAGEYLWTLDNQSMPENRDSLTYTFTVTDSAGHQAAASGVIRLRQEIRDRTVHASDTSLDKELQRYSLILFDYSSSQLDRKEADLIVKDMAKAVEGSAQLTLTGHTDRSGSEDYNEKLAQSRVEKAAAMLSKELSILGKDNPATTIESHGSRDVLFDNSLPEGRVLSRTVRALIEKDLTQ